MSVAQPKLAGEDAAGGDVAGRWSAAIDALFAACDRPDSPGLNLSIVRDGAVVHRRGYGLANLEDGAPFTAATRLHLGSTTKHFTTTCLLILEDRGALSLGDSVRRHLSDLPAFMDAITLRHLATMTSGLPDGLNAGFFAGTQPEWFPREAHLGLLRRLPASMFPPGGGTTYSNSNYLLLSQVIEQASGQALEDFMRAELFEPLGMTATQLVRDPALSLHGKAHGYAGEPGAWQSQSPRMDLCGDGGIVSTLADMEGWLAHYAAGGRLCRDYRARMEAEAVLSDGAATGYGLGLGLTPGAGRRKVSHGGGMPGYLSEFAYYPDDGLGVIWLANWMNPALFEATDKIAAIVLGARAAADAGPAPSSALGALTGVYVNHSLGCTAEFEQTEAGTILHVMGERLALAAADGGLIRPTKASAYFPFRVVEGQVGGRPMIEMKLGAARFETFTRFDPADADRVDLAGYVGAYRSPLLGETHFVRAADGGGLEVTLDSAVRSLIWRGLKPRGGDLFSGVIPGEPSDTDISVLFRRNAAGAVTGFDYNLSRFRGVRFERQGPMTRAAAEAKARLGAAYPLARQDACVELRHGVAVPDPFRGLGGEETGEAAAWCAAEQALTEQALGDDPTRRAAQDWLRRFNDRPSVFHTLEAGRTRFMLEDRPGADQPVLVVRDLDSGRERMLVDPAELRDEAGEPLILVQEAIFPSPGGRFIALYLKPPGDIARLQVRRVDTGEVIADGFPVTVLPNLSWLPDDSGFFHNQNQGEFVPAELRSGRPDGVYRHEIGRAPAEDALALPMIWPEAHAAIPTVSPDGRFLFVNLIKLVANRSALYALPLAAPGAAVPLCEPGAAAFGFIGQAGARCFFETDLGAPDRGRVVAFDMADFPRVVMSEAVAEQPRPLACSIRTSRAEKSVLAGDTLCLTYIDRAAHQIALFDLDGRHLRDVAMPMPCSVAGGGGDRYGRMSLGADGRLLVDLWTFAQTPASYAYDLSADAWTLVAPDRPPRALADVEITQIEYAAADGTAIPATILAREATPRDGSAPCLLYGYGAGGMAITPEFGFDIVAWLALGGVYVIANVRGGGEKGRSWHEPARGLKAQVSFDDFLAGAEHLIATGLARPGRLAVRGLSAGGLLVGAAITQKPALFAAAILEAPLVDPLSIGRDYWSRQIAIESGDPTHDPVAFAAIRRFSPLQALRPGAPYPSTLVLIGDEDAQMLQDGARKFTATLQSFDQPDTLHLFHILRRAGHGAWTVSQLIDAASLEMAFLALTLDAALDPAALETR